MAKPCCFTLRLNESDGNSSVRRISNDLAAKVRQGDPKPCHCWNQRGGIFKYRAQLGSSWDGLRLSFLIFQTLKNISWRRLHWKRYKLGHPARMAGFKTYCYEDKFWNLEPMPTRQDISSLSPFIFTILADFVFLVWFVQYKGPQARTRRHDHGLGRLSDPHLTGYEDFPKSHAVSISDDLRRPALAGKNKLQAHAAPSAVVSS